MQSANPANKTVSDGITKIIEFCDKNADVTVMPNTTGKEYLDGMRRINRGSYVVRLNTLDKTWEFLRSLNWMPIAVPRDIQYKKCTYFQSTLPEDYSALTGIVTLAEARKLNLTVTINKGAHGDELVCGDFNGELQPTYIVSCIIEEGKMTSWYPGDFTAWSPPTIPTNPEEWNENWAVKIV